MIDLYLRAPDLDAFLADMAAHAPWLFSWSLVDDGRPSNPAVDELLVGTDGHALDLGSDGGGIPVVTTPAVFDTAADGSVVPVAPAVMDPRFHANLRLFGKGDRARAHALAHAAFAHGTELVAPAEPSRVWS